MKKKLLLGIGALVVVLAALMAYRISTTGKASPLDTVAFNQGSLEVKVVYCRPSKRDRLIFGDKSAGALVPFGKYWRLGANAATEITFGKDLLFAGQPVSAGTYRMYAVPSASSWKVVLNSQPGKWGAFEPDHDKDVLTVEVPVESTPAPVEQFTISISGDPSGARLDLAWDKTLVRVPLAAR
jgi:hypothetical protein